VPPTENEDQVVETPQEVETATPDVSAAEPSAAEESGVETRSTLDVVKAALGGEEESPASDVGIEKSAESEDKSEDKSKDDLEGDPTEEELSQYTPNSQRRIRQLVDEKNAAKADIERYKPQADRLEQITSFMDASGLEATEVRQGFEIMAMMKSDPRKALEAFTPIVQELAKAAGYIVPEDMQERVRQGHLSEADARRISQAEADAERTRQRSEQDRQRAAQAQQAQATQAKINDVVKSVDDWNAQQATNDPDWKLKEARVNQLVELRIRQSGQYPDNGKAAVALAAEALKEINAEFKRFQPKREEKRPVLGAASTRSTPAPENTRDLIDSIVG